MMGGFIALFVLVIVLPVYSIFNWLLNRMVWPRFAMSTTDR